jgi:ribosomal protein S18 acetylase RimI-like enzyme
MNEHGIVCASIDIVRDDAESWGIVVSWRRGVDGLPDVEAWSEALESNLAQCREKGASLISSRVITSADGVPDALVAARAAMHRGSLSARGFRQCEGRVEYHMRVDEALKALETREVTARLSWSCIDTDNDSEVARAAELLRLAAEGDLESHALNDALGYLKVLLANQGMVSAPERVQVGTFCGVPAVVILLVVDANDGWSSIYYLGVLPEFRGRGLGAEAMLHGLRCLKAMGGRTYHDSTGSRNVTARALFGRLGRPPWRIMEEWRLGK